MIKFHPASFLLFLFMLPLFVSGIEKQKVDSLEKVLLKTGENKERCDILYNLSTLYIRSNIEKALQYMNLCVMLLE